MTALYRLLTLPIVMGILGAGHIASAQGPSNVIRVLDASGVEGIPGVVLLINPGDSRKSRALVTNTQGEAVTHDLHCGICTISAFDPRNLFASRTTEFSSSSSSFILVMQLRPLIDTVGDPKAVSIELVINDSKGQPLVNHEVAIRPTLMTLENNRLVIQNTGSAGRVNVQLRAGDYTVSALNGNAVSEARFEVVSTKNQCSSGPAICIVASPRSSRHMQAVSLELSSASLNSPQPPGERHVDQPRRQ